MKREFYYQDDRSNKFWTIELTGKAYVTTHGRIGTPGRETRQEFSTENQAQKEFEKLIASKLKKGYVESAVQSAPNYVKPDWAAMTMSEDLFWRIIRLFNWKKTGDDDAVIAPAVAALSQMSTQDIERFEDILSEKLYALDTEAHGRAIGEYAYETGKHFSVDLFLYARCCVVANGREFYENVLANPVEMPKDMDFEPLLYVASGAYERKTGKEFDYGPAMNYETFSNEVGWPANVKNAALDGPGPLVPPWFIHEGLPLNSAAWQEGMPAGYLARWKQWFQDLPADARKKYARTFEEPKGWRGFYKSLSQNPCRAVSEPGAGEMEKGFKVYDLFLPANEESPKTVEPRMRSFHDPAACPVTGYLFLLAWVGAARWNVGGVAELGYQFADIRKVISLVLTHVLRLLLRHLGSFNRDTLDRFTNKTLIMDVGASDRDPQWDALTICQQRPLGANFAPIRWVFASFFTPQRSLGHGPIHGLPCPFNSLEFVIVLEGSGSKFPENASLDEALKVPMQGTSRTKLRWHGFPMAAGPQDVKDTIEHLPIRQRRPSSFPTSPSLGQQRFYTLPKFLR